MYTILGSSKKRYALCTLKFADDFRGDSKSKKKSIFYASTKNLKFILKSLHFKRGGGGVKANLENFYILNFFGTLPLSNYITPFNLCVLRPFMSTSPNKLLDPGDLGLKAIRLSSS